jgi:hypothetical protein
MPMTAAERRRKYRERRKVDEQEMRYENLRLCRQSQRLRSNPALRLKSAETSLINALPPVCPGVSLDNRTSRAAAVVQRAICGAVLAEQNQRFVPLISGAVLPPGGYLVVAKGRGGNRADASFLQHVHFRPKKILYLFRTKLV